jgi:AmmeMemoRadiSam system protein B
MNWLVKILIGVILGISVLFFGGQYREQNSTKSTIADTEEDVNVNLNELDNQRASVCTYPPLFYDEQLFWMGVKDYQANDTQSGKIGDTESFAGAVVPHHLLASYIIADVLQKVLNNKSVDTIVLIGPNHKEVGMGPIITGACSWHTPFGALEVDIDGIARAEEEKILVLDEEVLKKEHSIGGLVSFIKYYNQTVKIFPIILSKKVSMKQIDNLSNFLAEISKDNKTVVVASVDFSHYLSSNVAEGKDQETVDLIKQYDYTNLKYLNSDYLDSPSSIITLQKVMQQLGHTTIEVLHNTNSGRLTNNLHIPTTSYFGLTFH